MMEEKETNRLSASRKREIAEEHLEFLQLMEQPQILEIDLNQKKSNNNNSNKDVLTNNNKSKKKDGESKKKKKKEKDSNSEKKSKKHEDEEEGREAGEDEEEDDHKKSNNNQQEDPPKQEEQEEEEGREEEEEEDEVPTISQKKKKDKEKEKEKNKSEMKQLLKSVEKIEEKLKAQREQQKIVICNIAIAKLIRVHKLVRNHPWLKINYGDDQEWIADYEEGQGAEQDEEEENAGKEGKGEVVVVGTDNGRKPARDGSSAQWVGLNWSFPLERNDHERKDLVVTVCSKDYIIGRYVVGKDEWKEIPESPSGFFSVSGDITSSLGKVGVIHMICQKAIAERPMKATSKLALLKQFPGHAAATEEGGEHADEGEAEVLAERSEEKPVDLSSSSMRERQREREARRGQQTPWKYQFVSLRVLAAAVMDLKSAHYFEANSPALLFESGDWMGMTEPVKNGGLAAAWRKLTWKIPIEKISGVNITASSNFVPIGKVYISADELLAIQPTENTSKTAVPIIKYLTNGKEITGKLKVTVVINHPEDIIESIAARKDDSRNNIELSESSVIKPTREIPFVVLVQEIICLDMVIPMFQKLFKNVNVKLHCGCNAWASYTDEVELKNDTRSIHWTDLRWKIPVKELNIALRMTLWNGSSNLGVSTIPIKDLLGIPSDRTGRSEIFAKFYSADGEITGKARITCRFENAPPPKKSPLKIELENKMRSRPTSALAPIRDSKDEADKEKPDHIQNEVFMAPKAQTISLVFPIHCVLRAISGVDLISAHRLRKNSPEIHFLCDRASTVSPIAVQSGGLARWENLNWSMIIREDSVIRLTIISHGIQIGSVQVNPKDLILLPVTSKGNIEFSTDLPNEAGISVGRLILNFQVNLQKSGARSQPTVSTFDFNTRQQSTQSLPQLNLSSQKPGLNSSSGEIMRNSASFEDFSYSMGLKGEPSASVVFDPKVLTAPDVSNQVSFKISVDEIDLWDLVAIHTFQKNSPQIILACGKFTATTQTQLNAGQSCFWTNLKWSFDISDSKTKLRITVLSKSVLLGAAQFSIQDLMDAVAEDEFVKRLSGVILRSNGEETGKIKMTFRMEAIRNMKKRAESPNRQREEDQFQIPLFNTPARAPPLSFPCSLTMIAIRILELLPPSHTSVIPSTSVILRLHCDNFYQAVENLTDDNGITEYNQLLWVFPLSSEGTFLRISLLQRGRNPDDSCTATLFARSLLDCAADSFGNRQCAFDLSDSNHKYAGKIQFLFTLSAPSPALGGGYGGLDDRSKANIEEEQRLVYSRTQHSIADDGNRSLPPVSPQASRQRKGLVSDASVLTFPSVMDATNNNPATIAAAEDTIDQPIKISVVSIAVIDLPKVHLFKANSPVCSLACGKYSASTEISKNTGSFANWENLNFQFSFEKHAQLRFLISSEDKTVSLCKFARSRVLQGTRTENGLFALYADLQSVEGKEAGKIKLIYDFRLPY